MGNKQNVCQICVMDDSDPEISYFGELGCNHCRDMSAAFGKTWFDDTTGKQQLVSLIRKIKSQGAGKEFDSILGLSGGIDSSYLALKAFDWGLRPLIVHVDGGWNSELAVRNIQSIIDYTGWELHTKVINWNEMRDLQISYLRSGVANQDVPQDHAFFSALYKFSSDNGIRYVLNGGNVATEGIFPKSWHGAAMDAINLRAIHKTYGEVQLRDFPITPFSKYYATYPILYKMRPVRPLNYLTYDKRKAENELISRTSFVPYPRKHGESVFTRFFQEYYLVEKFGIDKRLPHLSSQIVSKQMTRDEALCVLESPMMTDHEIKREKDFIARKLRISLSDFESLLNVPKQDYRDFPNWSRRYKVLKLLQQIILKSTGKTTNFLS